MYIRYVRSNVIGHRVWRNLSRDRAFVPPWRSPDTSDGLSRLAQTFTTSESRFSDENEEVEIVNNGSPKKRIKTNGQRRVSKPCRNVNHQYLAQRSQGYRAS